MIQRFQSLYVLVAAILYGVMAFRPLASVMAVGEDAASTVGAFDLLGVGIGDIILAALHIIVSFLYANRRRQIAAMRVLLALNVVFLALVFVGHYQFEQDLADGAVYSYAFVSFLPIVVLVIDLLALLRIRADDRLVRSMDRLR